MNLPSPLEPGTSLGGHYIVGSLINRGGYGAVYRGVDVSEGQRACAIKETYDVTPASRRQSLMEAAILFTVRNKHLPEVYDAFELNGRFYLVMQLVEGHNFLQLVRANQRPFQEREVIQWMTPIISVLQELHSRTPPVIHRDIKPGNIILTPEGIAVLVDFGITKLYEADTNTQTVAKAASEGFSPWEQYVGKTTTQSDQYALAATMYYLLTMRTPPAALERSFRDELVPPRNLNAALSERVERILLKALAVRPEDRYPDLRGLLDDLLGHSQPGMFQQPGPPPRGAPAFILPADGRNNAPTAGPVSQPVRYNTPGSGAPGFNSQSQPVQSGPQQQAYSYYPPLPGYTNPNPAQASVPYPNPYSASFPVTAQPLPAAQPGWSSRGPVPGAFNQGCLWGLLQGIVSALIIMLTLVAGKFTLTILLGLVIYGLAGFATTRKGGSSMRGIWAGFWAGIISVVVFWIAALLIYALTHTTSGSTNAFNDASIFQGLPILLAKQVSPHASETTRAFVALGFFYLEGLVFAMICGWIGGFLGRMLYKHQLNNS